MTPIGDKLASTILTQLGINPEFKLLSATVQLQLLNAGQQQLNNLVNKAGKNDYVVNNLAD
jgi:hypothetical protein